VWRRDDSSVPHAPPTAVPHAPPTEGAKPISKMDGHD
jgi:hypothetical protein